MSLEAALGSTGGLGFERARHQAHSEGGPVAGTMDQVRPLMREQRSHDCASLDWPTGPHPTPSRSALAPTADRSKTPAAGSRSRGIDSTGPVTEALIISRVSVSFFGTYRGSHPGS